MATVHRNGVPPKRLPWKMVHQFPDWQFNEETIVTWFRQHCSGHVQYDFVVFNGTKGKLNQNIEFTAWFAVKADSEKFRVQWM